METLNDNTIMLKVKAGDLDQLGLLFERYHRVLFQFFYNIHHDRLASEDLVQNVFERVLKYRARFRGEGAFKQWLFSIARNVSHDYYKKSIPHQSDDLEYWKNVLPEEEKNTWSEEKQLLRIAMQRLDPKKRELLTLSKLEGWRHQEIAALLGYSEGSIKVLIFRALKDLKKEYAKLI
ncbi:MAG: RNA polymerase sigma factor [Bacteroidota bacterium]